MYEFELYNRYTNETDFAYGYSVADMKRRCGNTDWSVWAIVRIEYID